MTQGIWAMSGIGLASFGHYYPQRTEFAPPGAEALGVASRHVADTQETVPVMAERAVRRALTAAGREPAELDLLVMSNCTTRRWFPEYAPAMAHALGARRAFAFDVCGACAGFVHGVQTAAALLAATSGWRLAVVVSAEQFSRRSRPGTRSALVVGDAAGAAVLERRPGTAGLLDSVLHATGADADVCVIGEEDGWMRTDRKVVDLAVGTQKAAVMELLARNDLTLDDIDFVVPHPGTEQVRSLLRERLGLPEHRYLTNFATCGNTASAAIPATVSEHAAAGLLRPGHLLLAPTAGAGWYSGGLLFRWWA